MAAARQGCEKLHGRRVRSSTSRIPKSQFMDAKTRGKERWEGNAQQGHTYTSAREDKLGSQHSCIIYIVSFQKLSFSDNIQVPQGPGLLPFPSHETQASRHGCLCPSAALSVDFAHSTSWVPVSKCCPLSGFRSQQHVMDACVQVPLSGWISLTSITWPASYPHCGLGVWLPQPTQPQDNTLTSTTGSRKWEGMARHSICNRTRIWLTLSLSLCQSLAVLRTCLRWPLHLSPYVCLWLRLVLSLSLSVSISLWASSPLSHSHSCSPPLRLSVSLPLSLLRVSGVSRFLSLSMPLSLSLSLFCSLTLLSLSLSLCLSVNLSLSLSPLSLTLSLTRSLTLSLSLSLSLSSLHLPSVSVCLSGGLSLSLSVSVSVSVSVSLVLSPPLFSETVCWK